jgi:C1A family cysteine protease
VKPLNGAGNSTICDLRKFATPIKDQGSCGSCWAFGTIAAAESSHFLWSLTDPVGNSGSVENGAVWQLSEQVLVDCCDAYDCNGCGGGGTYEPMQCAVDIGALPSTISHGYTATDNNTCSHSGAQAAAFVDSYFEPCPPGDEKCVKDLIGGESCSEFFTIALKTSIEVIDSFYDYTGGIYSDPSCPSDKHNHAVAIVGWGTETNSAGEAQDYWILRNSWGNYFFFQPSICSQSDTLKLLFVKYLFFRNRLGYGRLLLHGAWI